MKKTFICLLIFTLITSLFVSLIFTGCKKTEAAKTKEVSAAAESSAKEENIQATTSTETPQKESSAKFSAVIEPFVLPVDIKYIETAFIDKRPVEGDTYETTFLLDKGADISAVSAGKIIIIQELDQFLGQKVSPYYWIEIETGDNLSLTYLFIGKAAVEKENNVNQGQKIAISDGGEFATGIKGNFKIRIAKETQEEWEYFDLLK